jgi:hypothetical protein
MLLFFSAIPAGRAQVTSSPPVKPTTSAAQGASSTRPGRFQPVPRDESLQPLPPKTTGSHMSFQIPSTPVPSSAANCSDHQVRVRGSVKSGK